MFEFFKRRKIKDKNLDESFKRVTTQLSAIDDFGGDRKKLQHYILESCEQIIETTRELEQQKAEYRVVTEYLDDIKLLETMPYKERKELLEVGKHVVALDKAKKEHLQREKRISDDDFARIEEMESDIPNAIRRLSSNEMYQTAVKRDMSYLEGEKSQWIIRREVLEKEQKLLKLLLIVLFASFSVMMVLFFALQSSIKADITWVFSVVLLLTGAAGFCIFIRLQKDSKERKQCDVNLAYAVSLLNKVKLKYVNVTNAIDYSKDRYQVGSSYELNYLWECYIDAVKENQRYSRNNDEYELSVARLARILKNAGVHDTKMWISQCAALINPDEMSEVKQKLITRRQKIRTHIETNTKIIKSERDEVDRLMTEQKEYIPEIAEIIRSVDRLCGTAS